MRVLGPVLAAAALFYPSSDPAVSGGDLDPCTGREIVYHCDEPQGHAPCQDLTNVYADGADPQTNLMTAIPDDPLAMRTCEMKNNDDECVGEAYWMQDDDFCSNTTAIPNPLGH